MFCFIRFGFPVVFYDVITGYCDVRESDVCVKDCKSLSSHKFKEFFLPRVEMHSFSSRMFRIKTHSSCQLDEIFSRSSEEFKSNKRLFEKYIQLISHARNMCRFETEKILMTARNKFLTNSKTYVFHHK